MLPSLSAPAVLKWAAAAIVAWWVRDVAAMMQTLILFMCFDYASGLVAAAIEGKLSSRIGIVGLTQKVGLVAMLLFVHRLEQLVGHEWGAESLGAGAYAINEAISIVENFARIGVPIPRKWVIALMAVKKVVRFRRATAADLEDLSKEDGDGLS